MLRAWSFSRHRYRVLSGRYLSLGLIVFIGAMIGLGLGSLSANLACVWIANGVYIGFVLCINPRRRTELLVVCFVFNYIANLFGHLSPAWSLCLTMTDLVQVYAATFPFRRVSVQAVDLTRIRPLLKLGFYASLISCTISIIFLAFWMHFVMKLRLDPSFLLSWFCSDGVGAAVVVPLYWTYRRKSKFERGAVFRYDSQAAFLIFCLVVGYLFWQTKYPFLFLLFPMLIPVIYTSGFLGASWSVLITTVIAVVATAYGHGPLMLIHTSPEGRVLVLQFYLAVVLITALPFAALLTERERLVSTLRKSETRYREMARLDGLTQLPNRREFDSFLDISRQRSVRQGTPLSLLLVDIDHFKKLNDQHGHTVGDEYLRKMAAAIASAVPRKTDLVARYGGEEFGIILDSCDDLGAMMVAERIKAAAAALSRNLVAHNRPAVTISIGMATTVPELRTPSKILIDAADQGLYAAKRNGRDRIERGTNLIAQLIMD